MEEQGLFNEELITSAVRGMSQSAQDLLREEFNKLLKTAGTENQLMNAHASFSFLASSSFRGERCCVYPDCRMKKAPTLFEFAALYADQLHLPFDTGFAGDSGYRLEGCLRMVHYTRPLIDAGIVKPSLGTLHLCKACKEKLTGTDTDLGIRADELKRMHVAEFTVTARIAIRRKQKILIGKVIGPREYLETSPMYFEFHDFPESALRFTEETALSAEEILSLKILDRVFFYSIKDFISQDRFARAENATYLSDLPSETEFFRAVRETNEIDVWRMAVLQHLNHNIPVFNDLPMEQLIVLRNTEEYAFRNYRNAIQKAIRMAPSGGDPQTTAHDIWEYQIRPEVELLESKAHEIRKSFRNALLSRAVPTGMMIGVGLLGSKIPTQLSHTIEFVAGCHLLKDMLPSRGPSEEEQLASEDFYFLLRANQT